MSWLNPRTARVSLVVGALLALVGGYFTAQLYGNIHTEMEELLPASSRSVVDRDRIASRVASVDNLTVVILSKDVAASRRFVDDLAVALDKLPKNLVASIEYKVADEVRFFGDRQALFLEASDLRLIRDYVRDRIHYETTVNDIANIFADIPEPKLDLQKIKDRYNGPASSYLRLPGGYYATPDETARAVVVHMAGRSTHMGRSQAVKDAVENVIRSLKPVNYAPDLAYRFAGGVEETLEESAGVVGDLKFSILVVVILVTISLLLFYRDVRATLALLLSLLMGTLWTFGISYFAVGYLNSLSAFMGSIVAGNGINFGIIVLARYLEERRQGRLADEAVAIAMRRTAAATLTAALAAGLAYASLAATHLRAYSQFGIIGAVGMILCWLSAYTMLPALLVLFGPRISPQPRRSSAMHGLARVVERHPRIVAGISAILTATSIMAFIRVDRDQIIESDLTRLRSKNSMITGSGFVTETYLEKGIFKRYLSPVTVLAHTAADRQEIIRRLREKTSIIASIESIDDFVPGDQAEKIAVIAKIRKLLPPSVLRSLSVKDRQEIEPLLNPVADQGVSVSSLTPLVLRTFTELDGTVGNLIQIEPPGTGKLAPQLARDFVETIRNVIDSVRPGTPMTGTLALSYDMNSAVAQEGPRATLLAFASVAILVIMLFRRLRTVAFCLLALLLGTCWLGGAAIGLGLKVNFMNFVALPITFGIGIDYGVNVFQRYQQEGSSQITKVIRDTGGAVLLSSLTTIIGYSSLLLAGNQGFVSFGMLAVSGEIACVSAALLALPALLILGSSRR